MLNRIQKYLIFKKQNNKLRTHQTGIYQTILLIVPHSFQFCSSLNFKLFDLLGSS